MIVGNRGFFPDHLAKSGREEMIAAIEKAGYAVSHRRTRGNQVRRRRNAAMKPRAAPTSSSSIATRSTASSSRCPNFGDERAIADTLRMADLNVPVLVQATPDTPGQDDHPRPPRQLLRQDVGLQQPQAVRHSVFADHAAHRSSRFRPVRARISPGSPPSAAWCAACAACASAPSARARRRSTPSATARRFSKPAASPSSPSISPKSSAASTA